MLRSLRKETKRKGKKGKEEGRREVNRWRGKGQRKDSSKISNSWSAMSRDRAEL